MGRRGGFAEGSGQQQNAVGTGRCSELARLGDRAPEGYSGSGLQTVKRLQLLHIRRRLDVPIRTENFSDV